jgi:hypothetical protein
MKNLTTQKCGVKFNNIGVYHMHFKDLEWKDVLSDNIVVSSHCMINLCGVIKIEFQISHDTKDNQYYLYAFGKGSIRRLQPEKCSSVESAKNVAYRIYSNEMERIKKAVDYLVVT